MADEKAPLDLIKDLFKEQNIQNAKMIELEARVEALEKAGAFGSAVGDEGVAAKFEEEKQRG
jgi:hypothetical protein